MVDAGCLDADWLVGWLVLVVFLVFFVFCGFYVCFCFPFLKTFLYKVIVLLFEDLASLASCPRWHCAAHFPAVAASSSSQYC